MTSGVPYKKIAIFEWKEFKNACSTKNIKRILQILEKKQKENRLYSNPPYCQNQNKHNKSSLF